MAVVGTGIPGSENANTSGSLSHEVSTYYDKVFLDRARFEFVLKEGGQSRTHPTNEGRTVRFTRYDPLTIVTTPLGEASNPVTCAISASNVDVTLSEYGLTVNTSKMLSLVSIDSNMKEKIELVGQNMGETLNRLVRNELGNGTQYIPNGHTTGNVAAGDTLSASSIREMTRTLEMNKAMKYSGGYFLGKTPPQSKYSLLGDTTWVNAKTYSDVKDLYNGEMGELYNVRWLLNIDVASAVGDASLAACTVVMYYTYVHGDNSFGTYDLEKDKPKLYILPNLVDSGSPAGRLSKISWAGSYAAKILNSNWALLGKFTGA